MTEQELQDLKSKVEQLAEAVGLSIFMSPRVPADEHNANKPKELPNGDYNVAYRQRELGIDQDKLNEQTIPELRALIDDLGRIAEAQATQIVRLQEQVDNLQAPPADVSTGLPLGGDQQAVRDVRNVRELREQGHIVTFNADALRLDAEIHHGNHAFPDRLAIGAGYVLDVDAKLQVLGGGEVLFHSRVPASKTQEKDRDRTRLGVVSYNPYDDGIRFIRGAVWRNGVMHHNPDNPRVQILAMDNAGTVSKSVEDYNDEFVERSQLWIIQEDFQAKVIRIIPCRAGWGVEVAAGTTTTNDRAGPLGNAHLFLDRRVPLIRALPGAR
jgi:hypothetical protein